MNSNSNGRRVAVTGMGFITPIGNDEETVWSNLVEGVSGVGLITHFDTNGFDTKIAGEVKGFNPEDWMDRKTRSPLPSRPSRRPAWIPRRWIPTTSA